MKINKNIEIHAQHTKWIFEKKLKNGSSAIQITMIKLSKIFEYACQEKLYAYIVLSQLFEPMYKVKKIMLKLLADFEKLIKDQNVDLDAIEFESKGFYQIQIGSPIVGEMANLLELHDRLNCLLWAMNKLNLFKKDGHKFFRAISKNQHRIYSIMMQILSVNENDLKTVSINQYLNNEEAYQQASKKLGIVSPAELFAALSIEMFPRLPPATRNRVIHKLKHMESENV